MKNLYNMQIEEAFLECKSDISGLTDAEAQKRLLENGKNALEEGKKKSLIVKFLEQFKDVMIIVLLVAAVISAALSIINKEPGDLIDSGLILLIVIVNAVIGLVQENKAENALEALKNMNKPFAKVIRGGVEMKIKSEEIVVGDLIVLESGDIVPADLRLIESASLKIEEAALTGESLPSEKETEVITAEEVPLGDRKNMAYSTGVITYGRGKGVVVATGMKTEVGKIAGMLKETENEDTPLQQQLGKTAKMLSVIVLVIAAVIFAANLIIANGAGGINSTVIVDSFMVGVAIAVAAIPEGLPAVVTIVLSVGVQKMSAKNAIIRSLPAVETLGCCEIICSDKTGTLTLNQMTVKELYINRLGAFTADDKQEGNDYSQLINGMVLCNDTKITTKDGENKLLGDPTETALVAYAGKLNLAPSDIINNHKRVGEVPFDSVRKLMTTINETEDGKTAYVKGAPDMLIEKCDKILIGTEIKKLDKALKDKIAEANLNMAKKALRVLAVAIKKENLSSDKVESNLIFVGLVGMIDPPRPEVKDAVKVCEKAGMQAIMITGDHAATAAAIATEIGILKEGDQVMTGAEMDKLSDEEFFNALPHIKVFARVSPENKVRIVTTFKKFGKIVAMTGDGVNDAPSIKAADIGVGMGITGTDVSKGAADMVLADDNFATIVSAVEEGRKVYSNIVKAVQFLLSANIAEVLCLFIATVFLRVEFLTAVMILWVNLVTDSLPALALGMEGADKNIMDLKPRKSNNSLLSGRTGLEILIQGVFQTGLVLGSFAIGYFVLENHGLCDHSQAMSMAFLTLCMIQLFHAYNMRSQSESLFSKNPLGNKFMNIAFLVGTILIVGVIAIPGLRQIFDTGELEWFEWLIAIGFGFAIIPLVELQKLISKPIWKRIEMKKAQNK